MRMSFDPRQKLGTLSVSQMQSVEIAKAVSNDCHVLILDEPTSSLTEHEVEALFRIIDDLKAEGVSIIYISHKMEEILRISDEVTIMRDGKYIGTWPARELTTDAIITHMVGRKLDNLYPASAAPPTRWSLSCRTLRPSTRAASAAQPSSCTRARSWAWAAW